MSNVPPPPSYVALYDSNGSLRPPPNRRSVPRYHSSKKKSSWCYKCICFCYCALVLLLLILSAITFSVYALFKPQVPSYQVKNFAVQALEFKQDFTLVTNFIVSVRADNPNEKMEFIYGTGSSVTVRYTDSILCSGSMPQFRQGPKNVTVIDVFLKGKSPFGSGLQEAIMENQKGGNIPLLVQVNVPVSVVLAGVQMTQFKAHVNCSLVVDNLSPKKKISIRSSKYDVDISL